MAEEGCQNQETGLEDKMAEIAAIEDQIVNQYTTGIEQFNSYLGQLYTLLEMRKQEFEALLGVVKATKLAKLKQYKETLTAESSPPALLGGTSCGFVPNFSELYHATTSLVTTVCEPVKEGMSVSINVIGSLATDGTFWARLLPDETHHQDTVLQNISKCLQSTATPPLQDPVPGMPCAAMYSQDQVWYRGRIVSTNKSNIASVFFIDYGNTEDIPLSSLAPLADQYQVFPPQMIHCCLKEDISSIPREAKWFFTDNTHSKELTAQLIKSVSSPPELGGEKFVVKLIEPTEGEPYDLGASVLAKVEIARNAKDTIKFRDVRLRDKPQDSVATSQPSIISSQPINTATSGSLSHTPVSSSQPVQTLDKFPDKAGARDSPVKGDAMPPAALPDDQSAESNQGPPNKSDLGKPLTLIKPLVSKSSQQSNGCGSNLLNSLNPAVRAGASLVVVVTTDLSEDGTFWAKLDSNKDYDAMFERLNSSCNDSEDSAPGFMSKGQLCSAKFSEDESWYRARVEGSAGGEVSVRYLDYGNQESLPLSQLSVLKPEFIALPGLAFQCSIATSDHTSFNDLEIEKFFQLLGEEQPITARVTSIHDTIASVELTLVIKGSSIDINEEIYAADTSKAIKSQTFTLNEIPALEIAETGSVGSGSWADQMDDIASPVGDGLTLSGSDGPRLKSPSPMPLEERRSRSLDRTADKKPTRINPRSVVRGPSPIATAQQTAPVSSQQSSRATSPSSVRSAPTPRGRASPRLNMPLAQKQILSGLGKGRGAVAATAPGRNPPVTGTARSSLTVGNPPREPSPHRHGNTRDSTPPDLTGFYKLYIKNVPLRRSTEELVSFFSKYGYIADINRVRDDPSICFLTLSRDDADVLTLDLGGKPMERDGKPLIIQAARDQKGLRKTLPRPHH